MTTQIDDEDARASAAPGSARPKRTGSPAKWKWLPEPLFTRPVAIGALAAAAVAAAGIVRHALRRRNRD